jgi:5-methyltetrahydrofolate--homocysteine methyltransferase
VSINFTASVSGWYFANPDAKYFGVAKINQAQLEDYAKRKGVSIEQAERLLWMSCWLLNASVL